jgi:hypothetical protein
MPYLTDHKVKFDNLRVSLDIKNKDQLRRTANGGNSILFTYPPDEEALYLSKAAELLPNEQYKFIDLSALFLAFIDQSGMDDFIDYYKDFSVTPHLIFNSEHEENDLMNMIINEIMLADSEDKTPVLIRTGALFGTGIENVNIMEHKSVMSMKKPLVVFYPATIEGDNLLFLNFKPASKYRCAVIK